METIGVVVHFLLNATLCIVFWNVLETVAKQRRALQAASLVSLSLGFLFLTLLSVAIVTWVFGSTTGGFEGMGLPVVTLAQSLLVTPTMLVVGVGRLIWLNESRGAGAARDGGPVNSGAEGP